MEGQLLTFGCSWMFGFAGAWTPTITDDDYKTMALSQASEDQSFRTKLSKKYDLKNINFSKMMSSNERSFRIARELFSNKEKLQELKDNNTIVLWAITSTARFEWWNPSEGHYNNFKLDSPGAFNEFYATHIYEHDVEVKHLAENMMIWNDFFDHHNIPIVWVDTFNTHDYALDIKNLVRPNDLLSEMLQQKNINYDTDTRKRFYHMSSRTIDDPRIELAQEAGLVNPISQHPTIAGHDLMTEILSPYIKERL